MKVKILILLILAGVTTHAQTINRSLDPDFVIATESGNQVFREELQIALGQTLGANAETRNKFKSDAVKLAKELFRKGQKHYGLPRKPLTVYWDSLRPIEVAMSVNTEKDFYIHLNEILFFTFHDDHLKLVIPHEVAHLIHFQYWGVGNQAHDEGFMWIVKAIAPNYEYKELDLTAACRLSSRLISANGAITYDPECIK